MDSEYDDSGGEDPVEPGGASLEEPVNHENPLLATLDNFVATMARYALLSIGCVCRGECCISYQRKDTLLKL
jgi:hypothetical protein